MGAMGMRSRDAEAELNLPPGFRFHPTDEELVVDYLYCKSQCRCLPVPIIAEVDLYKYDPWELPEKALFGSKEWYFFTPRDRKYPNGTRPNRAAGRGYWKATGADKPVRPAGSSKPLGIKKALVFYNGKAPKGVKTDWIMHEYRLADTNRSAKKNGSLRLDDWVLCRLYNKKNNWKRMNTKTEEESLHMSDDTTSDSIRTPESGLDHDVAFHELDQAVVQPVFGSMYQSSGNGVVAQQDRNYGNFIGGIKEDNDNWLLDLKLEELQSCLGIGGPTTTTMMPGGVDSFSQDYWSQFQKMNQYNLPQFFSS